MKIGVLALQGDFREHIEATKLAGHAALTVRRLEELAKVDALILPGGESTTIAQLARTFGLLLPIRERIASGMPVYGSCAGMILLADRILDGASDQDTIGGIDMTVRRNAFGRQVDSFESDLTFNQETLRAVFIRAPWVEEVGHKIEILADVQGSDGKRHPVAVRQGSLLATSFHPELTGDLRVHRYFFDQVCAGAIK
ncbi:PDX2 Predicted glutamine amidotransferase involved in pyridoxine biosynthesis [Candidatus Nanopelagicaceae bacterium]